MYSNKHTHTVPCTCFHPCLCCLSLTYSVLKRVHLNVNYVVSSFHTFEHFCAPSSPFSLGAGANSKHVDLKLTKLVDVSPRRVASPSSPSSTSSSSSPTASSTSPVSPAEGQEVCKHSILFTLFLSVFSFYPHLSTPLKGHRIDRARPTLVVSQLTLCTHQSVGPLHLRPYFIPPVSVCVCLEPRDSQIGIMILSITCGSPSPHSL